MLIFAQGPAVFAPTTTDVEESIISTTLLKDLLAMSEVEQHAPPYDIQNLQLGGRNGEGAEKG